MFHSPSKAKSYPDLAKDEAGTNVTQRKRKQPDCELTLAISELSVEVKKCINDLRTDINNQFTSIHMTISTLREELNALSSASSQVNKDLKDLRTEYSSTKTDIAELNAKCEAVSKEVSEVKSSVNFNAENYADGAKRIAELELKMSTSGAATTALLENKIDMLEQQARQCNIEICNMPEKRGENLITVIESIASVINVALTQRDIVSIHRVPHAHMQNARPKNIIVKFTSRLIRDNVLSAYRLAKGLTSDRIGLTGTSHRIYMNEHLTLRNKELFRKCREAAKASKFKYVWVRNATVLVKETDDSSTYAVRTEADISNKIKSNDHSKNPAHK